jgi:hypothetical protein
MTDNPIKKNGSTENASQQQLSPQSLSSSQLLIISIGAKNKTEKNFDAQREKITISDISAESDIPVSGIEKFAGTIIVYKYDDKWDIINTGKQKKNFFFNGQKKGHFLLTKGEKVLVGGEGDNAFFIFLYLNDDGKLNRQISSASPQIQPSEFSLELNGAVHSFNKEKVCLIGKNHCNDFTISGNDFSACIYKKGREMWISSLDIKTPITVNSATISPSARLEKLSNIVINENKIGFKLLAGDDDFLEQMNSDNTKTETEKLVLIPIVKEQSSQKKGKIFLPSAGKSVVVGRASSQAQVVINSNGISKQHAQIIVYENSILLLDCYSTNGTFVDGDKISKRTVHPGSLITFAEAKYILTYV